MTIANSLVPEATRDKASGKIIIEKQAGDGAIRISDEALQEPKLDVGDVCIS